MVEILRYKDFSDSYTKIQAEEGSIIKDSLSEISDWSKYAVIVNGVKNDEKHVIQKDDVIIIRSIPKGDYSAKDWALTILTGGIYALGKTAYDSYKARKELEKELNKLKNHTNCAWRGLRWRVCRSGNRP